MVDHGSIYGTTAGGTYGGQAGFSYGITGAADDRPPGAAWILDGGSPARTVYATGLIGSLGEQTHGQSDTYRFAFTETVPADPAGASAVERYREVRSWLENTERLVVYDSPTRTYYREQHSDESLLLRVVAGESIVGTAGFWALVTGGSDTTTTPQRAATIDLELTYLADLAAYETHEQARVAHERTGL